MVGLTGGFGCGKSEVARILRRMGVAVLDTDEVTRQLQRRGSPCLRAIARRFGADVLDSRGRLNRAKLANIVFNDEAARKDLERIVHPRVIAEVRRWLRRRAGKPAVVVVPLLYEIGWLEPWDVVWCVTAPRRQVLARLRARGISADAAKSRMAAQLPVAEKARRADVVIVNNGSLSDLERKVKRIWSDLLKRGDDV